MAKILRMDRRGARCYNISQVKNLSKNLSGFYKNAVFTMFIRH